MEENRNRAKNKKILKIAAISILGFILLIVVASSTTNQDTTTDQGETTQQSEESIAQSVQTSYLNFWGAESIEELRSLEGVSKNIQSITKFEDYGSGNVLVTIQADVNSNQAREVGLNVMGVTGADNEGLDYIVVRGTNGIDVNTSRNDIPALR